MAKQNTVPTTSEPKVKRFTQHAAFNGGDGAKVTIYLRETKKGDYALSSKLREAGAKKSVTGCTSTEPDRTTAQERFDELVNIAVAHGWVRKVKKVRVDAFTPATFPTAKPPVAGGGLKATKKTAKK